MKRMIIILASLLAFPATIPGNEAAAVSAHRIEVSLPSFPVFLNHTPVDNLHSQYPLIVYKDITYFPMTWDYSRALGLTTSFDSRSGFSIDKGNAPKALTQTLIPEANTFSAAEAVLPDYAIQAGGERIDNASEPYPVLSFRNITYFPMTWRFTHDVFGWDTSWDNQSGYRIDTAASSDSARPVSENDNFNLNNGGQMAEAGEWIYFNPNSSYFGNNYLYKMKKDGSEKQKLTDDNAASINVKGEWIYYTVIDKSKNEHQGIFKVRTDGTGRTRISDAPAYKITVDGDWIYYVDQKLTGQGQYSVGFYKTLGIKKIRTDGTEETNLFQGKTEEPLRNAVSDSIHVQQDWIYFVQPGDSEQPDKLSKIRKDGMQLTPMSEGHFNSFLIVDDWIYYGNDNQLFKMSLQGSSSIPLRKFDEPVNFDTLTYNDGWIYYVKGRFGIMGSASIEKIRIDGSEPTNVIGGVRAVSLFLIGGKLYFAGAWEGDAPLYEVKADGQTKLLKEQ
ncbi:DUF5050 domain-containing protein [Paenibacillus thalictri]|nr:DUF5050 domain-containing protein [Paenibacillus thalictri]